jgi:hypothetical protein
MTVNLGRITSEKEVSMTNESAQKCALGIMITGTALFLLGFAYMIAGATLGLVGRNDAIVEETAPATCQIVWLKTTEYREPRFGEHRTVDSVTLSCPKKIFFDRTYDTFDEWTIALFKNSMDKDSWNKLGAEDKLTCTSEKVRGPEWIVRTLEFFPFMFSVEEEQLKERYRYSNCLTLPGE